MLCRRLGFLNFVVAFRIFLGNTVGRMLCLLVRILLFTGAIITANCAFNHRTCLQIFYTFLRYT